MVVVTAEVSKPEDVELTLTVRMPCHGWTEVCEALRAEEFGKRWHAARLRDDIRAAIRDVQYRALKTSHPEGDS